MSENYFKYELTFLKYDGESESWVRVADRIKTKLFEADMCSRCRCTWHVHDKETQQCPLTYFVCSAENWPPMFTP